VQEQDFVIRPICSKDLKWLIDGTAHIGPGFTSLPNHKKFLADRIDLVEESFKEKNQPEKRVYLFVREDYPSKDRIGISGIQANLGYGEPFYNYQISNIVQTCKELNLRYEHRVLNLVNDFQHATELISFWIHPQFRGKHIGRYLSLIRFLFIAQHRFWFGDECVAEIRGSCDENGIAPFWEGLGRNFYKMEFTKADAYTMLLGKQFISDLNPHEPIYLDLLPQSAREVVGVEHIHATGARKLLEREGFKFHNYIDIFDGGPLLNAETSQIRTVASSRMAKIGKIVPNITEHEKVFIYNCRVKDARFTRAHIIFDDNHELVVPSLTAKLLDISIGDSVRYAPIVKE
jgi:arginine N-succinyltransferase